MAVGREVDGLLAFNAREPASIDPPLPLSVLAVFPKGSCFGDFGSIPHHEAFSAFVDDRLKPDYSRLAVFIVARSRSFA